MIKPSFIIVDISLKPVVDRDPMTPVMPDVTPDCDCTRCRLELCDLPIGYYDFEWEDVPMRFPTHRERLIVVGLHSRTVLQVVDGTKTGVNYNSDEVLRWAMREPVALLHNHPDDLPEIEGMMRNEPSDTDCNSAHLLDTLAFHYGLNALTHVVVTRDSGYAIFNGRGTVKQGGMPCSPFLNM